MLFVASISLYLICGAVDLPAGVEPRGHAILEKFLSAYEASQSFAFKMRKSERMRDGTQTMGKTFVKYRKPDQIYIASLEPPTGQEVIFNPKLNRFQLVAHPGTFPDLTLWLSIHGSLATRGEHHTITHVGFGYTVELVRRAMKRARQEFRGEKLEYLGEQSVGNNIGEVIRLHAGDRSPIKVTAKDGESLFDFAARNDADAYLIFMANPSIDQVNSSLEPIDYWVPQRYGSKTEFVLSKESGFPLRQTTWDDEGRLYEFYEFYDLQINPRFSDLDFDPENPAYRF